MKIYWRLVSDDGREIGFGFVEPDLIDVDGKGSWWSSRDGDYYGNGKTRAEALAACAADFLEACLEQIDLSEYDS